MKNTFALLMIIWGCTSLFSQAFTELLINPFPWVYRSALCWGDYDNDGDLDVILTGYIESYYSEIYRNDDGTFVNINAGLETMGFGSAEWGDYDNDGDLDILLTGFDDNYYTHIYRNDSGSFTNINAGLPGVLYGAGEWGDYDNDGDLDIFLTGNTNPTYISSIYRNDSGTFTDINAGLPGLIYCSAEWGDYDNDGDLDLLQTGYTGSVPKTYLYNNENGVFTDTESGLVDAYFAPVDWGDYDNDGDLDLLLSGIISGPAWISKVYNNENGIFTDINAGLEGVATGAVDWGDYDNDGDLDALVVGNSDQGYFSLVYNYDGENFTDINASELLGVARSAASWGDYDNDGDLDIMLSGQYNTAQCTSKLYTNNFEVANTIPVEPNNLNSSANGSSVTLSWDKATDIETPQDGLTYNIYIGTASQTCTGNSPMSDMSNGYRKIANIGNTNLNNSWTIKNLPDGKYYWSVQAIDHTFSGSDFASEQIFLIGESYIPINVTISNDGNITSLDWEDVPDVDSYKIFAADEPYGAYEEVTIDGVMDGSSWTQISGISKRFYYVVSVITSK